MSAASVAAARRDVLRLLKAPALDGFGWSVLAAVTIGTNLLDFASVPLAGAPPGVPFLFAALARAALLFWAGYAITRHMAGVPRAYAITPAFARYAAYSLLILAAFFVVVGGGTRLLGQDAPLERQWLTMLAGIALLGILTIRLLAWSAALATGAGFASLGSLWRAQRGRDLPIILAFVALVLPLAAIHLALTLVGIRLPLSANATAALAVVDGAVQALQLAITCALAVVAWRGAGGALRDPAARR